ncbi:TonB-dependent receptor [Pelomonas sp. V22]|uniref:TonB-dependent receptor n=1 Tax=Pelomonas sp. V22 TaxID=2822139 RepID=UPI0024A973CD|nr:TonB-dependent receptor [Pelomonas sp. V22]MDI4634532.1 TonB-dependent receptor [Pelomonas sp. V22]
MKSTSLHQPFQLSVLTLALAASLNSQAQSTSSAEAPKPASLATVVVTGQAASLRKALSTQEAANNILSVISADDIGALPDINAAEALARMPGLSVQRDQGEGRYITVRGLGPDLNAVTINGALVPAPENGRRGVSLDVLPSGLIRSLEVSKTLTPDMDANSLGGTVEVKTLSAFDLPGQLLSVNGGAGYDTLSGRTNPFGGLLWADRFMGGKLGLALGAGAEKRKFASDDEETGGSWSAGKLTTVELRDYQPVRERKALALNLEFRPEAGQTLYAKTFWSAFSDDEIRDRLTLSNITGGSAAEGATFTARAERRLRQRKYTRDIKSLVLGGSTPIENWKLDARLGFSSANEDQPDALNDVQFRQNGLAGLSFTGTELPQLSGPTKLYDATLYNLNAITFQSRLSKDREHHGKFDLSRKFAIGSEIDATLKFGAKASRRQKSNDTDQWAFNSASATSPNYWGAGPTTLAGFTSGNEVDFPQRIGLAIDPALVRARVQGLSRAAATSVSASTVNDWTMHEDIDAAYAQLSLDMDQWNVLVGLRDERTSFSAVGSQLSPSNVVTPRSSERSYSNLLPNLQLRNNLDASTSLRAALTKAVVRANFSQLAPGVALSSPTEATIGNPDLKPLTATNLDLGIERVLGKDGVLSAYVFSKHIKDYTYTTNLAGTGQWAAYTSALSAVNGDKAKVHGVELAYAQPLRMLPGWASGLIVGANATFASSSTRLARFDKASSTQLSRELALPGQSDRVINLMLGYESGPLSLRLASNTKSRYLLQTGADVVDANGDVWVDGQTQLDFSLRYQISKSLQLGFEATNLNKEKYYTYQGSKPYNAQNEQYGRGYRVTLTFSQF